MICVAGGNQAGRRGNDGSVMRDRRAVLGGVREDILGVDVGVVPHLLIHAS